MPDKPSEIEIPQPVNRPKDQSRTKAEHPQSKITTEDKPVFRGPPSTSRFEPQAMPVEVPSHGVLYKGSTDDDEVARGIIKIRPITLNEEKILTTDRFVQQGKALDMILENCIKSNINPYDLLSSDRLYLLFFLRGMSYGLDYEFLVKCYHCGFNFEQTISVDKLPIEEWKESGAGKEPVVINLPVSKFTVEAHFMRGKDEAKMTEKARELRNYSEADDTLSEAMTLLIDKVTTSDGETLSPRDREDFINHMIGADADCFREEMRVRDCGIQPLKKIYCPRCEGELEFNVPMGRNFFRRSERGKK